MPPCYVRQVRKIRHVLALACLRQAKISNNRINQRSPPLPLTTYLFHQLSTNQRYPKMKLVQYIHTFLAAYSAVAFHPVPVMRSRQATMQLAVSADEDAAKLEEMSKTWDELRKKEKEVERSHDEASSCGASTIILTSFARIAHSEIPLGICKYFSWLLLNGFSFSFFSY